MKTNVFDVFAVVIKFQTCAVFALGKQDLINIDKNHVESVFFKLKSLHFFFFTRQNLKNLPILFVLKSAILCLMKQVICACVACPVFQPQP